MFFKKKDKGAAPAKAEAPAKAAVAEPRREETRRQEPARQAQPAAPPVKVGAGAAIDAALTKARAPKGAPASFESVAAQTAAADVLASSSDPADRAAARDIAAGEIERGFSGLYTAADADLAGGAARWRTLGALSFAIDTTRSQDAYLSAFKSPARQFWDCIWLARLRGFNGKLLEAAQTVEVAGTLASTDSERAVAHCEFGQILYAGSEMEKALQHAESAVALAGQAATPDQQHRAITRFILLGDVALALNQPDKARKAMADALGVARKLGAAAPKDATLALGICEILEKNATAAAAANDNAAASVVIEEAIGLRRRVGSALSHGDVDRGLARALSIKGEVLRAAGNGAGALAAFEESLALVRKIGAARPRDLSAQRDLWRTMWHIASFQDSNVDWGQVVGAMEKMLAVGALDKEGLRYLEEGRRRRAP